MDEPPPPHLAITDEPELLSRCVLLVADEPPTQFAVASTLTDAGAEVRFAGDAQEAAFRCASGIDMARPFDLIVVAFDPVRTVDACRRLRETGYHGPILAVGETHDADAVIDAGADVLLPSASDGAALRETTTELIGRPRVRDVVDRADTEPPVLSDLAGFPQMHVMLERYLDQLPQRLSAMLDAAAAEDLEELERLVCDLKRSAGSHGFIDISREAAETERHLRSTERLLEALDPLTELCRRAAVKPEQDPTLPPSA